MTSGGVAMHEMLAVALTFFAGFLAGDGALLPLLDFAAPDAGQVWQAVNDGVMGGRSQGRFRITETKSLEFSGNLSLENNGGFASVRTKPMAMGIAAGDTLVMRLKGDGREYMVNIYTTARRMAFSYRAVVATEKDRWQEIHVPLDRFEPTSFGRVVPGMGPVAPDQINGFGFMLGDKKPGAFRLEVEWVKVLRGSE